MVLPIDPAIQAIADAGQQLTFAWLRGRFGRQHDRKDELDFGHAVLPSVDLLDQYLFTHGLMIASQWRHAAGLLPAVEEPTRWLDYGCGQGLAGLLVRDYARPNPFPSVSEVVLIEPSALALRRATAIYQALAPDAELRAIVKLFDALGDHDIQSDDGLPSVHIFSNTLDLPGFDHYALLDRLLTPGRHTILAVSHHRTFNGGTGRFVELQQALVAKEAARLLTIRNSHFAQFVCDNPGASDAVVWLAEVDVHG